MKIIKAGSVTLKLLLALFIHNLSQPLLSVISQSLDSAIVATRAYAPRQSLIHLNCVATHCLGVSTNHGNHGYIQGTSPLKYNPGR